MAPPKHPPPGLPSVLQVGNLPTRAVCRAGGTSKGREASTCLRPVPGRSGGGPAVCLPCSAMLVLTPAHIISVPTHMHTPAHTQPTQLTQLTLSSHPLTSAHTRPIHLPSFTCFRNPKAQQGLLPEH